MDDLRAKEHDRSLCSSRRTAIPLDAGGRVSARYAVSLTEPAVSAAGNHWVVRGGGRKTFHTESFFCTGSIFTRSISGVDPPHILSRTTTTIASPPWYA